MVRANGVGHELLLPQPPRVIGADDGMGAIDRMGERLSDVMKQRGAPREPDIEPELIGDHAAEERGFNRVLPLVLGIARAVVQATDELDDLGMRFGDLELIESAPAELDDLLIEP